MKFMRLFDPKENINFVSKFKVTNIIGMIIPSMSVLGLLVLGINWGIDFSGGTEMQVQFNKTVPAQDIRAILGDLGFAKNQVQSYGESSSNEMLVRVERVTTLTEEDVNKVAETVKNEMAGSWQNEADVAKLKATFEKSAGDRITLHLPLPKVAKQNKKKDPVAIESALKALGGTSGDALPALDDTSLDAFANQGFHRGAVVAKAKELGMEVTASADKQTEAEINELLLLDRALSAQEVQVIATIDGKTGFKLRRTKRKGQATADTSDSINRSEPYEGMVKYIIHFQGITDKIGKALNEKFGGAEIRRVEFVDSQVSQQLRTDGALALIYALLAILAYVAFRFDIFFSPGAIVALVHDSLGALALFAFIRIEFDLPSVAALLTVVGYSINNTIVIYDRVREILPTQTKNPLTDKEVEGYVNEAVNNTLSRTINTTLTTLAASVALLLLTKGAVQNFAAVLSLGILLGAFSSTFIAPATYLGIRKRFYDPEAGQKTNSKGHSREDKERGIV
jgi:preprotein translocase subunit SecF